MNALVILSSLHLLLAMFGNEPDFAAHAFLSRGCSFGRSLAKHPLNRWLRNENERIQQQPSKSFWLSQDRSSIGINGDNDSSMSIPRNSSSPSALNTTTIDDTFSPPVYPKSREQHQFIENVLKASFVFREIHKKNSRSSKTFPEAWSRVVDAFEEVRFPKGSLLCRQGDTEDTEYLYVLYEGECSVSIDGKPLSGAYGTMSQGSLVGDIAVLYKKPRAATVEAVTSVRAFRLHRDAFYYFLDLAAAFEKDQSPGADASADASSKGTTRTFVSPKERMRQKLSRIDKAIDQISGLASKYDGKIIRPLVPARTWLWTRWRGTVLQHAWRDICWNLLWCATFQLGFGLACKHAWDRPVTWSVGMIPAANHPVVARLLGLSKFWHTVMGLVTFVLTFFLSQAYSLWRSIYFKGREIQGALNDISLLLACRAERDPETNKYTPRASAYLDEVSGCVRLFNALMWASFAKKFEILLTVNGLSRMLSRGVMTRSQYDCLMDNRKKNAGDPHHAALQWIYIRAMRGLEEGIVPQTSSTEGQLTAKIFALRDTVSGIRDSLDARMPLAYAQFVQLLVDSFLLLSPLGLYPVLGIWSIPAVGLMSFFYGGMLDLSKILLFPLEMEDDSFYRDESVNMDIGVLIRESNFGSNRWKIGAETLPF